MSASQSLGICPNCGGEGPALTDCDERVCQQRGYRRIPREHHEDRSGSIPDPLPGLMLGDSLVVKPIGAGAFGMVYLGLQLPVQMKVAIKLMHMNEIPASYKPQALANFEGEARALAMVTHPNVLKMHMFGTWRDQPYLVMEYVENGVELQEDIENRAARGAHYEVEEIRSLLSQMLDGLAAVHDRGIIHRDMKPGNVMLQDVPGYPRLLKILDFGLAKFLSTGDATKIMSGTPEYMAPEQLTRERLGPWTDLYAVGILAFELLTGHIPFLAENVDRTLFLKLDPRYDPFRKIQDRTLPDPVMTFLKRSMALEPEERYQTAQAMKTGLGSAMDALASAPGDPLAEISLRGLMDEAIKQSETTEVSAPMLQVEPDDGPPDSDDAFRKWLDREKGRLMTEARNLETDPEDR